MLRKNKRIYPETNFEALLLVWAEEKEPDPTSELILAAMSVIGFIAIIWVAI